ncbi:26a9404d-9e45-4dd9-aaa0-dc1b515c5582 [Sclerotinia trifoliorum]|uniref:26a9404d-9e45-4dd9-aaa0-dc1b515c5582 n=1 Tax=Sclerotinia trifoliorum TaxID=28548 RepID=A0A8H2VXU1_9HELO|nr:26a9404d-9e45-4dd9-aaa0-dc1b515c5582 [Sclerotinia trifoliorum]
MFVSSPWCSEDGILESGEASEYIDVVEDIMLAQLLNQLQISSRAIREQVIFAVIEYRARVHMDGEDVGIRPCATR